ncbi:right-handed parallel beta-helix repeat-containing protein [Dysgonomonas sp. GY75]|uniref:alpha-1,3-galactosidase-related protein n=1 Tax=Dysgonomonas sp. GY75 TaxID=2780419 RepID=UPI0018848C21|nr:right-handed parallel beta-helix repeat-containing protein [Dysgonomonas sp. GY75]MBF0648640.1 right-handed parallel beta-helix repeat-containing protein [Dysgonomonas sp. GY75]
MKQLLMFFSLLCLPVFLMAQVVKVTDFDLKPNTFEDAVSAVRKAIEKCKETPGTVLVFPKGRYDFWPDKAEEREYFISNTSSESDCASKIKRIGLLFENMEGVTVEGNGSQFIFHGKMITWAFSNCKNMKIQNLSVDFERPSMSEVTIDKLYPGYMIASIHPDSKYTIIGGKLHFYGEGWGMNNNFFSILTDTIEGTNFYSSFDPIRNGQVTEIAPFKVRIENDFSHTNYIEGHTVTTRDHIRDHVGVFVNISENIILENITLHYMHGLGIISQFSENLTYNKANIMPSRGRTIAAFADGMHFSGCKGHIEISNCNMKGLHDDPINVHGTYLKINEVDATGLLTMRFQHGQTYGMQAFFENDTVAFIESKTLLKKGFATVKSVKRISDREVQLKLSKPLPQGISKGDCLENVTWTPSLHISGCRFGMTNTRGVLITTPKKVVVENNYFYRTGMYAIQIAADANSWYESGAVNDVLIRNNIFEGCAYNSNSYVIAVEPENHERVNNQWVHRNVRIEDNIFKVFSNNLLVKARSTEGIYFGKNRIERAIAIPVLKDRINNPNDLPFRFEGCTKVKIEQNIYNLGNAPVQVECLFMKKKDIKAEKGVTLLLK